ncbi:MAG: hypothetical protein QM589_02800 [Thermomicrobiales bacterium]
MASASSVFVRLPSRRRGRLHQVAATIPLLMVMALCSGTVHAQSVVDPDLDSDGDGIVNAFDPDDDNDGITDDIDPAPFDASVPGSAPTPSSIDPDADSDNDGIANSHDPDDDNDSWVDAKDPVVFDPSNTLPEQSGGESGGGASQTAGTSGSSRSTTASSTSGSSRSATMSGTTESSRDGVVLRLPNTGAGDVAGQDSQYDAAVALAIGAFVIALMAFTILHHHAARPMTAGRRSIWVLRR